MRPSYESVFGRLLDFGCGATLLLGGVALAMLATRQPARRLRLARLGLFGVFALPVLDHFEILPRFHLGPRVSEAIGYFLEWASPGLRLDGLRPGWSASTFGRWGMRVYLFLVALGAARLTLGWLGTVWLTSRATAPVPELAALYESIPFAGSRPPRLRISNHLRRAMLVGVRRPTILLPKRLESASTTQLLAVLAHELAHAESSDPLFGILSEILMVAAFPVLPLWWIRRQSRLDQEFAADDHASDLVGNAPAYASTLLTMASSGGGDSLLTGGTQEPPVADGSNLYRRVLLLLKPRFVYESRPPLGWLVKGTLLVSLATIAAAMIHLRPDSSGFSAGPRRAPDRGVMTIGSIRLGPGSHISLPRPDFDCFVMSGDLRCTDASLSRIVVAGLHFAGNHSPALAAPVERVHQWTLTCQRRTLQLTLDGRPTDRRSLEERLGNIEIALSEDAAAALSGVHIRWDARPPK